MNQRTAPARLRTWIVLTLAVVGQGCDEPPPKPTPSRPKVEVVVSGGGSFFEPLRGDPAAEMAELKSGDNEEVDLKVAAPTPEELRWLPRLPHVKTITIRTLQVTQDHLDVLADKCPNLEHLHLFEASVEPGLFASLPRLKSLRRLSISIDHLNDAALAPLRGLPLTELSIQTTQVTDAGMEVVGTLVGLERLYLSDLPITDAGIEKLASLSKLKWLILSYTEVTDVGLKAVARFSDLTNLNINGTKVTDAGLAELSSLSRLTILNADGLPLTDRGLETIAAWPQLEVLSIWDAQMTDSGLAILGRMKSLRSLGIGRTPVTDAGLPNLERLPLKGLNLSGTATTLPAIRKLKEVLPGLTVTKYGQTQ